MKYKNILFSTITFLLIIGGALIFVNQNNKNIEIGGGDNVAVKDNKQVIEIDAKGGYSPRKTLAKAGIPTIIRFKTSNTFDCSIAVRLPSKGVSKILPQTGSSDIDLGTSTVGQFYGTCGMGMYSFEIDFN